MDEEFVLDARGGKKIYGWFNRSQLDGKSRRAIMLSHGLTGHPQEYIHQMARDYFTARGYDVIRPAYYSFAADARKLRDCTLAIHAGDFNRVLDHYRAGYDKIFAAGHSYGGLTLLFANPDVAAVSFWDSSYHPWEGFWRDESRYVPELDGYTIGWGCDNLIGKAMIEEAKNITPEAAKRLAVALKAPAQVILAGDNSENKNRTALYDDLAGCKEFYDVPGANHTFSKNNVVMDLLSKTSQWLEQF